MRNAQNTRIKAIAGATVAAVALMGAGSAVAGAPVTDSEVKLKEVDGNLLGKVTSDKRTCEKKRTVRVYRKQEGEDKLLGSDVTDSNGKYFVDLNLIVINTAHYAIALPKEAQKANCTESKSKDFFPQG